MEVWKLKKKFLDMERCDGRKSSKQRLDHPPHHNPIGERVEVGSIKSSFVGAIKKTKQTNLCMECALFHHKC